MADEKEKTVIETLTSFKDLKFDAPVLDVDLDSDAWGFGAPPPAGVYTFKFFMDKDGCQLVKPEKGNPSTWYTKIKMLGKLVDNEEWEGTYLYDTITSMIYRGKSNSTMAGFVDKAGARAHLQKQQQTIVTLAQLAEKVLAKEPVVKVEIDWKGSYKYTVVKGKDVGEEKYDNPFNHMTDFPWIDEKDKAKGRNANVTITGKDGNSHDIRAMLYAVRYLAKNEEVKAKMPSGGSSGGVVKAIELAEPELGPQVTLVSAPKVVTAPVAVVVASKQTIEEDDFELALSE